MIPSESSWGWRGRHYAEEPHRAGGARTKPQRPPEPTETETRWSDLLEKATPGVKDKVTRAFKQWNNILRDYLRTETALRLTVGDDAQAVPVKILDGMPWPFAAAIEQLDGLEWLLLNRPFVQGAARGTQFLESSREQACQLLRAMGRSVDGVPSPEELGKVRSLAEDLLAILENAQAVQKIAGINEDVLGAYFFKLPEIRLYWMVIGIVATALGVEPEALAVVVLAHELAHAYTHLGRDIDNERWDVQAFAAADLGIVEGLAQFYTGVICRRLQARMPEALAAYSALLKVQAGPYHVQESWVDKDEAGGEIVRVAMIECRSRKITKSEEFDKAVSHHRQQVRGRQRKAKEATGAG